MSRVFDGNALNYLKQQNFDLAATVNVHTFGVWVLSSANNNFFMSYGEAGSSNGQQGLGISGTGTLRLLYEPGYMYSGDLALNQWVLVIARRRASGGSFIHELFNNGVVNSTAGPLKAEDLNGSALLDARADTVLGQSTPGSSPATCRLAHAFTFLRALSDQEISDLAAGGNPSSLDPSGRREYYPLVDSSLVNEWADAIPENPPALTMFGTVVVDTAENPSVSAVAVDPAVTLDDSAFEPGKAITGTYANYASAPTVVTLTDSAGNTLTPAVTINDTAKTFSTAYPARITTGSGTTLLRGPVTLELT